MSNALKTRESVSIFALSGRLGKAEFADYLAELDRRIERDQPFVMIVDGSNPELVVDELPVRGWQLSRAEAIAKLHRGVAFVTGPMTHDRVRALYALQPPGVSYAFFADVKEAVDWAHAALDGATRSAIGRRKTQPIMTAAGSGN